MDSKQWQKVKELFSATLDLPVDERRVFLENTDESLRVEVEKLLVNYDEAENFIGEPAVVEIGLEKVSNGSYIGKKVDDYLILEEIGAGGMGAVFLAEQQGENLSHRVALKLIKRGMDTNSVLKRFVMERQILANLEHPFIARFLDGGSTADGVPYFVMEFVEGLPVKKYCDAHNLDTRARLELFRKICSAVSFAHQNLIVHRDLKPSNILVTESGEPKLLDFGIAKLLHPDWSLDTAEATATVFRVMTPEYASPEQLKGETVTTASDVYSLGVVLYELLTGERPFKLESRSPEEAAQIVFTQEPVKPSECGMRNAERGFIKSEATDENQILTTDGQDKIRNPQSAIRNLKGDLDNIILKALRKEPERRYQTVQEFSEDIRRHLEGLPVSATADTISYRVGKFVRRHRAGVFAAVFIALTLVTATAMTAWQAYRANRERERAEQRFNDVRRLANAVVFEFHDSIQNLPGSTPTRELLVSRALEYLDKLAAEAENDLSLQLELADAYDKIGDIQGGYNVANLGQREKAKDSYHKALALKEKLVAAEPSNVEFRRKLATGYKKMGDIGWIEADFQRAFAFHQKAWNVNRQLFAEFPENHEIALDTGMIYCLYGRALAAVGQVNEALEKIRDGSAMFEEMARKHPTDAKIQESLAFSYERMGEILLGLTPNYSEALRIYRKSQTITAKFLAANPSDPKLRRSSAIDYLHIAQCLEKLGDKKAALDEAAKSVAVFNKLVAEDPKNEEYSQTAAVARTLYCELLTQNGRAGEAINLLNQSLETFEKSFAASPTDAVSNFRIAETQMALGRTYAALGSEVQTAASKRLNYWREARVFFEKSLVVYQKFQDAGMLTGEEADRVGNALKGISDCDNAILQLSRK